MVEFDEQRRFRDALGHFATGVAIVTAKGQSGEQMGMTISSFNSVSIDPPLVLFSVARTATRLSILASADAYAVNVLRHDQEDLCRYFARSQADRADVLISLSASTYCPIIDDALATFECIPHAEYDGGDHLIFVGEVVKFRAAEKAQPLLFYRGKITTIAVDVRI